MSLHGPGPTAPHGSDVARNLLVRVLAPAAVLWVAVVATGFLLVDVIEIDERAVSDAFVDARTSTWDSVTTVVSELGNTQVMIATALVVSAIIWWTSRQWWLAIVPLLALAVEAAVFLTSSLVVARDRPDVEQLDHAPPTSSFPSGHTGASTAVYIAFALCASRIRQGWLRVTVQVICVLVPVGVGVSRVYRGMHHPTDVIAGLAVGVTCALIAWTWMPAREPEPDGAEDSGASSDGAEDASASPSPRAGDNDVDGAPASLSPGAAVSRADVQATTRASAGPASDAPADLRRREGG